MACRSTRHLLPNFFKDFFFGQATVSTAWFTWRPAQGQISTLAIQTYKRLYVLATKKSSQVRQVKSSVVHELRSV
jgi:hypothetical protein